MVALGTICPPWSPALLLPELRADGLAVGLRSLRCAPDRTPKPCARRCPLHENGYRGPLDLEIIGARDYAIEQCCIIAAESRGHMQACLQACGAR